MLRIKHVLWVAALLGLVALSTVSVWARGGRGGGGGFRGGGFGGGGFRGGMGGGGFRPSMGGMGGYRGMSSFNRTPSFNSGGFRSSMGNMGGGMRGEFSGMNRPNIDLGNRGGFNSGLANRGEFGNRANNIGIGNRGDIGNRANIGNRTNIGNNTFNNRNININNRPNWNNHDWNNHNWNNWGGHNGYWGGYHNGWVHGYWHGWNNGFWGGWGLGALTGWGLGAWAWGAPYYTWGYAPYYNPYYVAAPIVVQQPLADGSSYAYNYSQPIDTETPPPEQSVTDQAIAIFDQARDAFKQEQYDQALQYVNQALAKLPQDAALHEFLALVYFAQAQYDKAAGVLYGVLSVGPGWDWATLIGLYPNIDVYTKQLRALEDYRAQHPDQAAPRFVLAYHYMAQGHPEAAIAELKAVVQLQPKDTLSAQLLAQLQAKESPNGSAPDQSPSPAQSQPEKPGLSFPIAGTWSAQPSADTAIRLTLDGDGKFNWSVDQKGQKRTMTGESTEGNGLLTLASSSGGTLVGKVTWTDANHFNFKVGGDGPGDPGLSFSKR